MRREALLVRPEGPVPYGLANDAMHRLAERRLAGEIPDVVIVLEHPPVFTGGRRARPDELLWSMDELAARGAEVHRIDRGGAFTFHGPGQLVGYPILDLGPKPDAAAHLRRMEEAVIRSGEDLGVALQRREDVQTGVWHGPDLSWFEGIVACGLPGHGVTSLSRLAERPVTIPEVAPLLERHLADVFDIELIPAPEGIAALLRPVPV